MKEDLSANDKILPFDGDFFAIRFAVQLIPNGHLNARERHERQLSTAVCSPMPRRTKVGPFASSCSAYATFTQAAPSARRLPKTAVGALSPGWLLGS
jgi:hypothetical protein